MTRWTLTALVACLLGLAAGCRSTRTHTPAPSPLADARVDGARDWWALTQTERAALVADLQAKRNSPAEPMGLFTLRSPGPDGAAHYRRVLLERVRIDNPDAPLYHISYYLSPPCPSPEDARASHLKAHGAAPLEQVIAPRPDEQETLLWLGVWRHWDASSPDALVALIQSPRYVRASYLIVVDDYLVPVSQTLYFHTRADLLRYWPYLLCGDSTNLDATYPESEPLNVADLVVAVQAMAAAPTWLLQLSAPSRRALDFGAGSYLHLHEGSYYRFPYWLYLTAERTLAARHDDPQYAALRYWLACELNSDAPTLGREEVIRLFTLATPGWQTTDPQRVSAAGAPSPTISVFQENLRRHGEWPSGSR